jgi:nucleoside-diphosphate-sugar epimerase
VTPPSVHGRRILVTGASGFIGTHLLDRLGEQEAEVHAVSRRPPPESGSVTWHQTDLTDLDAVRRVVGASSPDLVFHLAGETRAARTLELVLPTFQSNLLSTVNLLTAVAERDAARVVLTGSLEEAEPGEPTSSPYALSKSAARAYGELLQALVALPVVVLRVFMVYGPKQRDLRKLVPYVILSLLHGERPQLTSGRREVDWVYVGDVADAFLAAAAAEDVVAASVDVGSGCASSIRSLVLRLVELIDSSIEPDFEAVPDRPREQARVADVEAAAAAIGWQPRVGLDDGLAQTVSWYRDQLERGVL